MDSDPRETSREFVLNICGSVLAPLPRHYRFSIYVLPLVAGGLSLSIKFLIEILSCIIGSNILPQLYALENK